jgi:hypothetical protein
MGVVLAGFGILYTWRTLEIAILSLIIYLPDALSLWFLVKLSESRRARLDLSH